MKVIRSPLHGLMKLPLSGTVTLVVTAATDGPAARATNAAIATGSRAIFVIETFFSRKNFFIASSPLLTFGSPTGLAGLVTVVVECGKLACGGDRTGSTRVTHLSKRPQTLDGPPDRRHRQQWKTRTIEKQALFTRLP